jgi:ribosome-binding factor A
MNVHARHDLASCRCVFARAPAALQKERSVMSHHNEAKRGHRAQRLERVSAEMLEFELLPSLENPLLNDLHVLRVEAAHNLATLHAVIVPGPGAMAGTPDEIQAALDAAENFLRLELAGMLRVKRMPALRITFLPLPLYGNTDSQEGGGA